MMETYSVLFRGFIKLSKNLLAFTTHWVANTNKTKCQTFIYLFEKKYILYHFMIPVFLEFLLLSSTVVYCLTVETVKYSTVKTAILETAVPCVVASNLESP